MKEFKEVPKEKLEIIRSIMKGSPNSVSGSPWLSVYPCKPEDIFDNSILINKAVKSAILISGCSSVSDLAQLYSCDIVRADGNLFDIDRHLFFISGSSIFIRREIKKDFPEHHSSEIPYYY